GLGRGAGVRVGRSRQRRNPFILEAELSGSRQGEDLARIRDAAEATTNVGSPRLFRRENRCRIGPGAVLVAQELVHRGIDRVGPGDGPISLRAALIAAESGSSSKFPAAASTNSGLPKTAPALPKKKPPVFGATTLLVLSKNRLYSSVLLPPLPSISTASIVDPSKMLSIASVTTWDSRFSSRGFVAKLYGGEMVWIAYPSL